MSYLVLARKYRPSTFDEVVEQTHVTQTLKNAVQSSRVAHAILFSGPRGTGKTTIARILAKSMNCYEGPTETPCNQCRSCLDIASGNAVDVLEVDGASNNGVEHIRDLRDKVQYRPAHCRFKIYIIDEVHMLSTAAFNALLKTLEEPPEHVLFMFATTEPHKIPITILSRCQRHDLRRVDLTSITQHLQNLCEKENIPVDAELLNLVSQESGGSMRDALSLLDQVIVCLGNQKKDQGVDDVLDILGILDRKTIFNLSDALLSGNIPDALDILHDIYDRGHDLKKMINDLITHFRNLLIVKLGKKTDRLINLPAQEIEKMKNQVETATPQYINQIFDGLFQEETFIRYAPNPRLAFEKTVIKIASIQPVLALDSLIEKIDQLQETITQNPSAKIVYNKIEQAIPLPQKMTETAQQWSVSEPELLEKKIPEETILDQKIQVPSKTPIPENKTARNRKPENDRPDEPFSEISTQVPNEPLDTSWQNLLTRFQNQIPAVAAGLKHAKIKSRTSDTVTIEINGPSFAFDNVKQRENELKTIINDYFQQSLKIEWLQGKASESALMAQQKKNEQAQQIKNEAQKHPLVQKALRLFNGKIVNVNILK